MIRRIAIARVSLGIALACLGTGSAAQVRKVSPPSRYGPSGNVSGALIAPDGRSAVYGVDTSDGPSLQVASDAGVRTLLEGHVEVHRISHDGRFLVYHGAGYEPALTSVLLDGSAAPRVLTPAGLSVDYGRSIQVSAQGWVVFLAKPSGSEITNDVYAVPLDGRQPPRKLDDSNAAHGGAWWFRLSPDGRWVGYVSDPAATADYELYLAPVTGASPARKVNGAIVDGGYVQDFDFTPTSEHVVYKANAIRQGSMSLFGVPVQGPEPAVRLDVGSVGSVNDFRLSADGQFAFYLHNPVPNTRPELFRVPVKGHVAPVRQSGPMVDGGGVNSFEVAPDGSVVYRADQEVRGRFELYHVEVGGARRKLNLPLAPTGDVGGFQSAPGARVLFVVLPERSVFLGSLKPSVASVQLPAGPPGMSRVPFQLSAGGEHLLSLEGLGDSYVDMGGLYSLRLDGASDWVTLVPDGPELLVRSAQLLAGGRALVYANTGLAFELFSVPIAGGAAPERFNAPLPQDRPLDHAGASALDGEGRWAAFVFGGHGGAHLYRADLEAATPAVKLSEERLGNLSTSEAFRVAPVTERIVFRSAANGLWSVPIDGSAPALFHEPAPTLQELQLSPDGTHALYVDAARHLRSVALDGRHPPLELPGFQGVGTITFGRHRIGADGARVVYHFRASSVPGSYLLSAPIDGSGPPVLLDPARSAERLLGIADGRVVFQTISAGAVTLWSVPIGGRAAPIPLATANLYQGDRDSVHVAGNDVYYVAAFSTLFHVAADGSAAPRALAPGLSVSSRSLFTSPRRLYFEAYDGTLDLYGMPRDLSSSPVRLSRGRPYGSIQRAVEAPGGSRVVYLQQSYDDTSVDLALWSVPGDGSREPQRLTEPLVYLEYEEERIDPGFELSRDGRVVAFQRDFFHYAAETSSAEVLAVPSNASAPARQVSPAPRDQRRITQFHLDPRGRFALFTGDQEEAEHYELFVAPIPPAPSGRSRTR